ncbi:hypothetical protein GRI89_17105 [Altererythrobacter salegens]|uniref:Spore coat protein U domain-containing protein n=2 Tax=Croceibacterium salegens TaxID=1737568 RepID=A0A6I4SYY5_9SPHN|nr:hypothetical protein [Croceibacterium salegens]
MPALAADKVRITGFSDVPFGVVSVTTDQTLSQSICAYSSASTGGYWVSAQGSGSGGAFTLDSGAAQLPYDVYWADSSGQTGGRQLTAGSTATGFTSAISQQFCNSGPPTSASLTIVLRASVLTGAIAGSYSGTLEITLGPE